MVRKVCRVCGKEFGSPHKMDCHAPYDKSKPVYKLVIEEKK